MTPHGRTSTHGVCLRQPQLRTGVTGPWGCCTHVACSLRTGTGVGTRAFEHFVARRRGAAAGEALEGYPLGRFHHWEWWTAFLAYLFTLVIARYRTFCSNSIGRGGLKGGQVVSLVTCTLTLKCNNGKKNKKDICTTYGRGGIKRPPPLPMQKNPGHSLRSPSYRSRHLSRPRSPPLL